MNDNFFDEWYDDKRLFNVIALVLTFFLATFVLGVNVNFPELKPIGDVFIFMLIVGTVVGISDYHFEDNKLTAFLYGGRTWKDYWQSLLIGAVIAIPLFYLG